MTERSVTLGDSYDWPARSLYVIELVEGEALAPLPLHGLTIQTAFVEDTTDEEIPLADVQIYARMVIDDDGNVTESDGLALVGSADDGEIYQFLSAEESAKLPPGTPFISDVRTHRLDMDGNEINITTFTVSGTLEGRYGIVNRVVQNGGDA